MSSFLVQQVDSFYAYMAKVYLDYHLLPEKPVIKVVKPVNATMEVDTTSVEQSAEAEAIANDNIEETRIQTFAEYFLYKLYFNYGIKRRMVAPDVALLFYAKGLKGYKSTDPITMLCRHMMLDTHNMRIISLGVPKAMKLDEFCTRNGINPDDAATNLVDGNAKFTMYRFPEGTMMVYNPSLSKFNVNSIELADVQQHAEMEQDDTANANAEHGGDGSKEAKQHAAEIEATIATQFAMQIQYSTRKVAGTGRFSSLKTFMEMFQENNHASGLNLDLIPDNIILDKALVFNIEHVENRVVSAMVRNYNTLCAVYQFKSDADSTQQYAAITAVELIQGVEPVEETRSQVQNLFQDLGRGMVVALDVNEFCTQLAGYGVHPFLPDVVRSFGNSTPGKSIDVVNLSLNQLNDIVQSRPKDFQGYIIYGTDSARTKIVNTKYKDLKVLKGNKPIVLEQWNTKNLFYLYWRLVRLQMIPQFIAEFDMTGGWSYNQLFYWFASLAHGYSVNLFRVYHNSFVKKSMDKYNIPYSMKPMCGDLHNMYKANKVPISQSMVEQYVFSQSAGKMFWRLFSGK
jgi:hypothetical protein